MQRIKRMLPIASVRRVGRRRPSNGSNDRELLSEAGIVIAGLDPLHPFIRSIVLPRL